MSNPPRMSVGSSDQSPQPPLALRAFSASISSVFAFLLLLHTIWFAWLSASRYPTIDFFTFWSVSRSLAETPVANIYSLDGQREMGAAAATRAAAAPAQASQRDATAKVLQLYGGRIDSTGSPLLYTAIGLISSRNYAADQHRYLFISALCLLLSLLIFRHLLRFTFLETFLLLAFLFWNFEPLASDLSVGNVNSIQLLFVALFIYFLARSKPVFAGLAIGAVTAFKPTTSMIIVLAILILVFDREYRPLLRLLAGCAGSIAASLAVSSVYFARPDIWLQFLRSLPHTLGNAAYSVENGNVSLSALLFTSSPRFSFVIPLFLMLAFVAILALSRIPAQPKNPAEDSSIESSTPTALHTAFAAGGCGCAIMLLASPLVWQHYYLLLLPLSVFLISSAGAPTPGGEGASHWNSGALLFRLAAYLPFVVFSLLFERYVGEQSIRLLCSLIVLTTLAALALGIYSFWRYRRTEFPAT